MCQPLKTVVGAAALATMLLAGCAYEPPPEPLYRWGAYEDLIYAMYTTPDEAPPEVQIERLSRDIQEIEAKGKRVGPGVHAHLGYMYYIAGNLGAARQAFLRERELFPESQAFMDRIVKQMDQS